MNGSEMTNCGRTVCHNRHRWVGEATCQASVLSIVEAGVWIVKSWTCRVKGPNVQDLPCLHTG